MPDFSTLRITHDASNPRIALWFRRYAQAQGFQAAVQWRDSGKPIPEGDEARGQIRALEGKAARGS